MSQTETAGKQNEIMDVNQQAVLAAMHNANVMQLIHGHTHRPDTHCFEINGNTVKRIVLGDWYKSGNVLVCDEHDCKLETIN